MLHPYLILPEKFGSPLDLQPYKELKEGNMTLRILHSSDLHGKYKKLIKTHADTEFDVWVDTGDFFDNVGRVAKTGGQILDTAEKLFQSRWMGYKRLASRLKTWLNGRPAILMPGNHDFIQLGNYLKQAGCPNVHVVTTEGVEVLGLRWAGFRQIKQANETPEWMGEVGPHEANAVFRELMERTLESNPDILVTHAPPAGILNGRGEGYGIEAISTALTYQDHAVRAHFFGHDHVSGGMTKEEMGIRFFNGACHVKLHELDF